MTESTRRVPGDRPAAGAGRSWRFLALYTLANAGGVVAYLPLLTLLLPLKVSAIDGGSRVGLLAVAIFVGAIVASLANILFGILSDRSHARRGRRRRWIVGGLIATIASYGGVWLARDGVSLVVAIAGFQVALNMMLAPLVAVMADEVPDSQKGLVGGLLGVASPFGGMVGGLVTGAALLGEGGRLAVIAGVAAMLVTPILAFGRFGRGGEAPQVVAVARPRGHAVDLMFVGASRLSIQIAGNVLFAYLLFYFQGVDRSSDPLTVASHVGHLTGFAFLLSIPLTIVVGRTSDRTGVRKPYLVAAALMAAAGLSVMALATGWGSAVAGFALFASGSGLFLGLHSAYAMQILPSPRHRGRDLGLLNLTNTLPALLGPPIAWMLAGPDGFGTMLLVLAMLAMLGGLLVLPIRSAR
ncbi:hypothetical protein ASE75_05105 [Sphingomonas sp. Leaf17]|uniref:MFS transporter n=1 Tax=Sphingomonas sp. Leaf17 TaxID=1735683 RepID=UPI0006F313B7|nr:MFS transporter [Sphingomonas sp. Leaf17]KQM65628.1 hypothetical protein ASE75_05105 [Sphingomonas sp. Leaf17]